MRLRNEAASTNEHLAMAQWIWEALHCCHEMHRPEDFHCAVLSHLVHLQARSAEHNLVPFCGVTLWFPGWQNTALRCCTHGDLICREQTCRACHCIFRCLGRVQLLPIALPISANRLCGELRCRAEALQIKQQIEDLLHDQSRRMDGSQVSHRAVALSLNWPWRAAPLTAELQGCGAAGGAASLTVWACCMQDQRWLA